MKSETRNQKLATQNPPIIQITDPALAAQAGVLLASALEASFEPNLPDPGERMHFCTLLYTANTRWSLERGEVWCTTAPDGALTGVLSLIHKPEPAWSDGDDIRYGYDALTEFSEAMTDVGASEYDAHVPFEALPGEWTYVNVLGVKPAWQGQGLGTSLMAFALVRADQNRHALGLITDTARNVRFYQRLGFETVREGNEADQSLWTMIRPAQG
jgi:GNAT superfamily N-acetyltransferase